MISTDKTNSKADKGQHKTLYSNIQTCVMNNGWISEIFRNLHGIRQCCPLSALLFVLSVEIMACLSI
jgi:hypothetical protein